MTYLTTYPIDSAKKYVSMQNTITLTTTTRPTDSIIQKKLELFANRNLLENTMKPETNKYRWNQGTFDIHKNDIVYIQADEGTPVSPNTPRVIEYINSPALTVPVRTTDNHNNNVIKVGTLHTGAEIDTKYPLVIAYEQRQEFLTTNVNGSNLKVHAVSKSYGFT